MFWMNEKKETQIRIKMAPQYERHGAVLLNETDPKRKKRVIIF